MSMLSSMKLRPLVAAFRGGRARLHISVGAAKSQKHLLSEFKGVRGPQSEEVRLSRGWKQIVSSRRKCALAQDPPLSPQRGRERGRREEKRLDRTRKFGHNTFSVGTNLQHLALLSLNPPGPCQQSTLFCKSAKFVPKELLL